MTTRTIQDQFCNELQLDDPAWLPGAPLVPQSILVDTNGKTPGQVLLAAWWGRDQDTGQAERDEAEQAASAVLRAFNGDALRRVRTEVEVLRVRSAPAFIVLASYQSDILAIIDSELAKLDKSTTVESSKG